MKLKIKDSRNLLGGHEVEAFGLYDAAKKYFETQWYVESFTNLTIKLVGTDGRQWTAKAYVEMQPNFELSITKDSKQAKKASKKPRKKR